MSPADSASDDHPSPQFLESLKRELNANFPRTSPLRSVAWRLLVAAKVLQDIRPYADRFTATASSLAAERRFWEQVDVPASDEVLSLRSESEELERRCAADVAGIIDNATATVALIEESASWVRPALIGEIDKPAEVQAEVDDLVRWLRAYATTGKPTDISGRALRVAAKLLRLAHALREPAFSAGSGRKRRACVRKGPESGDLLLKAALLIKHGEARSQRDLAELLGVSQPTISRMPAVRELLKSLPRMDVGTPPPRGAKGADGILEAEAPEEDESD